MARREGRSVEMIEWVLVVLALAFVGLLCFAATAGAQTSPPEISAVRLPGGDVAVFVAMGDGGGPVQRVCAGIDIPGPSNDVDLGCEPNERATTNAAGVFSMFGLEDKLVVTGVSSPVQVIGFRFPVSKLPVGELVRLKVRAEGAEPELFAEAEARATVDRRPPAPPRLLPVQIVIVDAQGVKVGEVTGEIRGLSVTVEKVQ